MNLLRLFVLEAKDWIEALLGVMPGITGINLRHTYYRFRLAVSEPALSVESLVNIICPGRISTERKYYLSKDRKLHATPAS